MIPGSTPLVPLLPAGSSGAAEELRKRFHAISDATATEVLSVALAAEAAGMTGTPSRGLGYRAAPSKGETGLTHGLAEPTPHTRAGRRFIAPNTAIVRAHRLGRTGLEETILALYYGNLSLFRVEETARAILRADVNGATISSCIGEITPRVEAWMQRPISQHYDFVFLGNLAIRQRLRGGFEETGLYYAVGIDARGAREVLGVHGATVANESGWTAFWEQLARRGLKDVRLWVVGMDDSLIRAAASRFPAAQLQVCVAQLEREVLARVPVTHLQAATLACATLRPKPTGGMFKAEIRRMLARFDRNRLTDASDLLRRMLPMAFNYRSFPSSQWSQISTMGGIRNAIRPFRERLRCIGPIDDTRALALLTAAHLRHVSRKVWGQRRFLRFE